MIGRLAPSTRFVLLIGLGAFLALAAAACGRSTPSGAADLRNALQQAGVEPLMIPDAEPAVLALGEALFFDPELSGNRDVSCATCHEPELATTDGLSVAIGTGGVGRGTERRLGDAFLHVPRNSPDLFNRGSDLWHTFFWDGRVFIGADGLVTPAGTAMPQDASVQVAQAMITIASPIEMRGFPGDRDVLGEPNELALFEPGDWEGIWSAVMARLVAIEGYRSLLAAAYPGRAVDDLDLRDAVEALVAYQSQAFRTVGTPFDRFLAGDDDALLGPALDGAILFYGEAGCAACHSGPLLTDQRIYSIAAPQVGPGRGAVAPLDAGRGAVDGTGTIGFRTPPLRNVTLTGPYLHAGAYLELEAAVRHHLDPEAALEAFDGSGLRDDVAVAHLGGVAGALRESVSQELSRPTLTDEQIDALLAFLGALTDPAVGRLIDLVPDSVPSGLPLYR